MMRRAISAMFVMAALLAACAAPRSDSSSAQSGQDALRSTAPKRIVSAIRGAPVSLVQQKTQRGGSVRGLDGIEELAHAGLTYVKADGTRAAQLADAVPTIDSGLWKVFPDGRMETTWRIKPNARWHDGTPFTAEDLAFTARVAQDADIAIFRELAYDSIEDVAAPDPRTVVVRWSRPFIEADTMFSGFGSFQPVPLPRHL